jgi:uncharacterized RDD family membrane protein YckC
MSKKKILRRYQTFSPRLRAGLIDSMIFFPLSLLNIWIWESSIGTSGITLWCTIATFSHVTYSILLHRFYGQTLGKRIMKIRVLSVDDEPITMRQAVLRDSV